MTKSRLLFVDNDSAFRQRLAHALRNQRRQWDMTFVSDAEQARLAMADYRPDAIILDIQAQAGGGLGLLKQLRADPDTADLPIVVLARRRSQALKRKALKLGATDLLTKPLGREDLIVRLQGVLRLTQRQDQIRTLNEALERKVRQRTAQLERSRLDVIWRLAKVGEYRDEDTGNHIIRVGRYCGILAEKLGLAPEQADEATLAAPLHDIGKIGIPDAILLKQGPLTPQEWSTLETHCVIGSDILLQQPKGLRLWGPAGADEAPDTENRIVRVAASIALTHHERWDGKGYPLALRGQNIPLLSRIVAVADVYDALRSARPYKPEYPQAKTLAIMNQERGQHFDPDVYDAFVRVSDSFGAIRMEHVGDGRAEPATGSVRDFAPEP